MKSFNRLVRLPRWVKRLMLMANDGALLALAVWLAFSLRLGELYVPPSLSFLALLAVVPVLGVAIFRSFGLYRLVTRYIDLVGKRRILYAMSMTVLAWGTVVAMSRTEEAFPRSAFILVWLLGIVLTVGARALVTNLLGADKPVENHSRSNRINVLIYGAGSAGNVLAKELELGGSHHAVAFIDDDETLWQQKVGRIKVRKPEEIGGLIERNGVTEILLALPSATRKRRQEIVTSLKALPVRVKTVPSLSEIASGKIAISDIRPISVDDILGRDPVPPDEALLTQDIRGKCVLITGAGGSIGSELARQVLGLQPATLILFELSEVALYDIEMEIRERADRPDQGNGPNDMRRANPPTVEIIAKLGNILDGAAMRRLLDDHKVATVYHAAAYKHVPIVELNPVSGLRNNTFGTLAMVEAAQAANVKRFVLISTDKAVRPTNIMGASKRLAELVLQAHAVHGKSKTIFTMVRFGNVLASSGSVVRRFTSQIKAGGPVTVTDRKIIRYFMSIPEAAQLVIQAGAMSRGGDVFVLNMGEPVKIDQLARIMITLAGFQVDDGTNDGGDIAIEYVGLRPGEKLYEELLIGETATETAHSRIMKSDEPSMPYEELKQRLAHLLEAMENHDLKQIKKLLRQMVEGYHSPEPNGSQEIVGCNAPAAAPAESISGGERGTDNTVSAELSTTMQLQVRAS